MPPIDELNKLGAQVENATELGSLRPIFNRMTEIARQNDGDFEVQIAAAELRRHILDKGLILKEPAGNGSVRATTEFAAGSKSSRLVVVELPPPGEPPRRTFPAKPFNVRRAIITGAGLGIAAWLIIFVILVQIARNHNMPRPPVAAQSGTNTVQGTYPKPAPGTVPVDILTTPPGAAIQINGEAKCKSNCRVNLAPGNYQVTAVLDGFDPRATGVTVVPGAPLNVSLTLVSQQQAVRVFTDLDAGKVLLDGKPAGALQDGQIVLDAVSAGKHSLRVIAKNGEAQFSFENTAGKQPVITSPITVSNMIAVVVTSVGAEARIQTSSATPVPVSLNGQPRGDAGPQGLELKDVPQGEQTLTVGIGQDQRKLVVPFGPLPSVTTFLKSDISTGMLVVSTSEDDVTVYVNGKPYPRKTRRGELRIKTVGKLAVRVAKPGFQPEPEQQVEIKKGEETKLAFRLTPLPKLAGLQIRNGVPGTLISIDGGVAARVGPDGSFSAAGLAPGQHTIEVRREGYAARHISRTLKAGEISAISAADLALVPAVASIHLTISPPDATVTYRRSDEAQSHVAQESSLKLDPGSYVFNVKAPNFIERTERTTITAGENRNIEIALVRESKPAPAAPKASAISWDGWSSEGGEHVRKGGGRVVLHSGRLSGTITFTAHLRKAGGLFRSGKLRWFIEGDGGYSQFELDNKNFVARGPDGSRSKDRVRADEGDRTYTIQIEVTPGRIINRVKSGDNWVTIDSRPVKETAEGSFGVVIPGGEEIGISNLRFTPL